MVSETVAAIIVTAAVTLTSSLGAIFIKEHLDYKKNVKERRLGFAEAILREINFAVYYIDHKLNMALESSKFMNSTKDKELSEYTIEDASSSISILTSFMTPDEVLRFFELTEQDPKKGISYLLMIYFYDLEKFRLEIINMRKTTSGFSIYYPDSYEEINLQLNEFYETVGAFDWDNVTEDKIAILGEEIETIVAVLQDLLNE
jgi:hypothetical protein